jgi:hypothetical protein
MMNRKSVDMRCAPSGWRREHGCHTVYTGRTPRVQTPAGFLICLPMAGPAARDRKKERCHDLTQRPQPAD